MVTFDICKGNPGALTFVMLAYEYNPYRAEAAFRRMQNNGITGDLSLIHISTPHW